MILFSSVPRFKHRSHVSLSMCSQPHGTSQQKFFSTRKSPSRVPDRARTHSCLKVPGTDNDVIERPVRHGVAIGVRRDHDGERRRIPPYHRPGGANKRPHIARVGIWLNPLPALIKTNEGHKI